ncbi:hypothetical protein ACLB2K_068567 [Fragaria x ananassa]
MSCSDYHEVGGSSPPAVEYVSESELGEEQAEWNDQDRSLYLCVADYYGRRCKVRYSVYRINLKALLFSKDLKLGTAFAISNNHNLGACAGFGMGFSTLLLAGGFGTKYCKELVVAEPCRDIWDIQTRARNNIFQANLAPFLDGKVRPLIWNVDGNLFALARNPPPPICAGSKGEWTNCFEMCQSADSQWVRLPDPPSYAYPIGAGAGVDGSWGGGAGDEEMGVVDESVRRLIYYSSFSFAILGSQLFVSNPEHPEYSYKCNLSRVNENWPVEWKVSRFRFEGATLGVQTAQGFVVFSHDVIPPDSPEIKVHLLINGSDEPMMPSQSLMLPPQDLGVVQDSQFVDLGGQKVCFLYSKTKTSKLLVTAITFSFRLEEGNKFRAKFYPTRNWEFQDKAESEALLWNMEQMVGAVVG